MSDGEVLLSAAVARLGRYNDVVAAAYRTTFAFEEVIRCRAPDPRPPTGAPGDRRWS